jgi:signal transduction histidine kinase
MENRSDFLAKVARFLFDSLFDYEKALKKLAHMLVPALADWCVIDLIDGQHNRRLEVVHKDPAMIDLVNELRTRVAPEPADSQGLLSLARVENPELYSEVSDSLLVSVAYDKEHLKILQGLGFSSCMIVPLKARNKIRAVITFVIAESDRCYVSADLDFARELADIASIAIGNSLLFQEAREANRLKDEFLTTLSHEMRMPLTSILGWIRLLRSGRLDDTTAVRAMETIERNVKSQVQLVNDLLDISRIITGNLRLDIQPVDLTSVIKDAVDSLRPVADSKSIRLQIVLDSMSGPVSGDPERLMQVVWNLVSNAIKFTPKGGRVQIRLERINSHVEIIVSDTGEGINPESLPNLFDRFQHTEDTSARENGGLSLGLSIVHHLVDLHGGSVSASSPGKGQGATFTVKLPLLILHRDLSDPDRVHPTGWGEVSFSSPPEIAGLKIMVVDDEPDTCEMLKAVLESCKAIVKVCNSSAEALEEIDHWRADLLISDIGMPGGSGYELIKQIRSREKSHGKPIPAIALTAYARVEDRIRAISAGFNFHVRKPVDPTELVAIVASLAVLIGERD